MTLLVEPRTMLLMADTENVTTPTPSSHYEVTDTLTIILHRDAPLSPGRQYRVQQARRIELGRGGTPGTRFGGDATLLLHIGLEDKGASERHAMLTRIEPTGWQIEDLTSRNGTWVNGRRIEAPQWLSDGDVLEIGKTFLVLRLGQRLKPLPAKGREHEYRKGWPSAWTTFNATLEATYEEAFRLAPTRAPCLILGPTGVGKERLALGIHELSHRKARWTDFNCATLNAGTAESELFGHVKGTFTGATKDRAGLLEAADGSTLFLDELGHLAMSHQALLLRSVETGEIRPVGATAPKKVDVRLIAATSSPLGLDVFLPDLRFRLGEPALRVPALTDRREDLGLIIAEALTTHLKERADLKGTDASKEPAPTFDAEAARALLLHSWPGGARQLSNVLQRLVIGQVDRVTLADLGPALAQVPVASPTTSSVTPVAAEPLTPAEPPAPTPAASSAPPTTAPVGRRKPITREALEDALRQSQGHAASAGRLLGVHRQQIYRRARQLGLHLAHYGSGQLDDEGPPDELDDSDDSDAP